MKHQTLDWKAAAAICVAGFTMAAAPAKAAENLDDVFDPDSDVIKLGGDMRFTEGPVWIPSEKKVVFSDIPASAQMQWVQGEEGVSKLRDVEATNGNALDLEGRLVSCQHAGRNIVRWDENGDPTVLAATWDGKKFNSPNDLAVHSDGSIWFTDPSYGLRGEAGEIDGKWVYRLDPKSGDVTVIYRGFDMPNGIAFSPDEKRVYISDTGEVGKVRGFNLTEDGMSIDDEPALEIDIRCDGMCIDVEGSIYTTSAGGIHVFTPAGAKLGVIPVPEQPANVCFGGDDFKTLFITARTSLYSAPGKIAGAKPKTANW